MKQHNNNKNIYNINTLHFTLLCCWYFAHKNHALHMSSNKPQLTTVNWTTDTQSTNQLLRYLIQPVITKYAKKLFPMDPELFFLNYSEILPDFLEIFVSFAFLVGLLFLPSYILFPQEYFQRLNNTILITIHIMWLLYWMIYFAFFSRINLWSIIHP